MQNNNLILTMFPTNFINIVSIVLELRLGPSIT